MINKTFWIGFVSVVVSFTIARSVFAAIYKPSGE